MGSVEFLKHTNEKMPGENLKDVTIKIFNNVIPHLLAVPLFHIVNAKMCRNAMSLNETVAIAQTGKKSVKTWAEEGD